MSIYQIYKEDKFGSETKYIQLINAIKKAIEKGELKKLDRLPSNTSLFPGIEHYRNQFESRMKYLHRRFYSCSGLL
jgi:DNA-binding transcriptional MocR family regulator